MKRSTLKNIAKTKRALKQTYKEVAPVLKSGAQKAYAGSKKVLEGAKYAGSKLSSGAKYAHEKLSAGGSYLGSKFGKFKEYLGARSEAREERDLILAHAADEELIGNDFEAGLLYAKAGYVDLATGAFDRAGYISHAFGEYANAGVSFESASYLHAPNKFHSKLYANIASRMYDLAAEEADSDEKREEYQTRSEILRARSRGTVPHSRVPRESESDLVEKVTEAAVALFCFSSFFYFLSFEGITGAVIGSTSTSSITNFISIFMLLVGLVFAYLFSN